LDNLEHTMTFVEGMIGIELSHRGDGNHVLSIAPGSQAENHSDILLPGHRLVRINQLSIPRQMSTKHIMETLIAARGGSDTISPLPIDLTFKPPDRIYELARSININDTTIIKFPMFVDWFYNKRRGTKESMLIGGLSRGGVTESSIKVISNFRQNLKALRNAVIQLALQTVYRRHTKSKDSLNARGLLSWIEILRVSSIEGARGTKPTMADAKFLVQKYGSSDGTMSESIFLQWMMPCYLKDRVADDDNDDDAKKIAVAGRRAIILREFTANMRREIQPEVSKALLQKLGIKTEERMRVNASFSNKKATMAKEEKEHNAKRAKKQKNFEHKKKLQKESKKWNEDHSKHNKTGGEGERQNDQKNGEEKTPGTFVPRVGNLASTSSKYKQTRPARSPSPRSSFDFEMPDINHDTNSSISTDPF